MPSRTITVGLLLFSLTVVQAQSPVDVGTISRIRQEALTRSQVMDHVGWMSDVYGPRVTGTPNYARAADWAVKRLNEWGLANVHQERFAFGQGWRVERFSAHLISPEPQPIIGFPRTYSPSTKGTITGEVVRVDIRTKADLARYTGQLKDKIVLPQPARNVRMLEDRLVLRMNEQDIAEALTTPIPAPSAPSAPSAPGAPRLTNDRIAQFFVAEGVAAVLERGSDNDTSAGGSDLYGRRSAPMAGRFFPAAAAAAIRRCRHRCRPRPLPSSTTTAWCACSR